MRNLKRVLSLALACVMVIGMMVMTTGAADIADIDEVKNTEAVTVMNALKVLEGDENGNFNPTGILTREQAAKIICVMLMGKDNADLLVGTSNFSDVAADRWSAPYIAYCASLDIISGYDGKFDPTGELTGVAFAKMLLVALGYDAKVEGYVNNANWATNIGSDAIDAGLNVKGVDLSAALTRDNAAQMAFQTLEADMVEYETKGTTITLNGVEIISGASKAEPIDYSDTDYDNASFNNTTDTTLQFCEKYFKDLTKETGAEAFNRPVSYAWNLENVPFHTAVSTPVATFTAKTNAKVVAEKLVNYKMQNTAETATIKVNNTTVYDANYGTNVTVDGVDDAFTVTADKETVAAQIADLTANGKLVEIYADRNKFVTDIVTVSYTTGKITAITTDDETGDVTYKFPGNVSKKDFADEDADDEIVIKGEVSRGDYVTYVDQAGVRYVYPTTSFEGTQTANKTAQGVKNLTIDGETYKVSSADSMAGAYPNSDKVATYYLDQYGFVIAVEDIDVASTDYLWIANISKNVTTGMDGDTPSAEVRVVLADGTVAKYDLLIEEDDDVWYAGDVALSDIDAENKTFAGVAQYDVYGYTIEGGKLALETLTVSGAAIEANEVYNTTLASVEETTNSYADASANNTVLLTQNTVVINYNATTKRATVYNGFDALPNLTAGNGYAVIKSGMGANASTCTATVVFMSVAATELDVEEYVYINKNDVTIVGVDEDRVYEATTVDGETVEFTKKANQALSNTGLYKLTADGKLGSYITLSDAGDKFLVQGELTVSGDMVKAGDGNWYYMTDDTKVVYIDSKVDEVDGNQGIVVLEKATSSNVATIFMVGEGS